MTNTAGRESLPAEQGAGNGMVRRFILRTLQGVERVGNRLPDPVTLFVIMIFLVLVASWVAALFNLGALHPGTGERISAVNLFAAENLQRIFVEMHRTFTGFPPLGLVLVVMLGIGVAERTGLVATALRLFVRSVPKQFITAAVVLAGLLSSIAVDAGYVVLIPLGAVVFHGVGRHPIAGLAAAFAGVSGGFSANLALTSLDPLLAGITTPAAQLLDPAYEVLPTANYFLMVALVPLLTIAGTIVTERIIEPHLGRYDGEERPADNNDEVTPLERRGLIWAGVTVLVTLVAMALLVVPENGVLRDLALDASDPDVLFVQRIGPFLNSMVALMFFFFLLPGLVYGIVTKTIRSDRDVANMTTETMASMGAYIVLAFVAAHLVAFFNWSNLGLILAIGGADLLKAIDFTGIPLIVSFVLVSAFVNLFIGSASAKWALMAPVFVPMLMLMGYSPELTQASYRIGDSFTNILTPLLPYFPLIIVFARKYDDKIGIGSILSVMLPFSVAFALVSIPLLVIWMVFGLPIGIGAPMHYGGMP